MNILYEDKAILVVTKPPGVPSQPDKTGDPSVLSILAPKNEDSLFVVHRLDRSVSGVMLLAKTKQAAASLAKTLVSNQWKKGYLAVVCGKAPQTMVLTNYLIKLQHKNMSFVATSNEKNAKLATLSFQTMAQNETLSLLSIKLETGRHHQIRVQLAHALLPIFGDTKYNPAFLHKKGVCLALFANMLSFSHPTTGNTLSFSDSPKFPPFDQFL